ncbi:MAG: alpha-ribazole phosphatase [Chloroflexota bacterium]|nr:alpha-ribazole phosphatase [Anaerolineales bacterium]MCB8965837.1 alpha-ribazole phosphatase [Ardenticatenaceae bacterium]
MVTRLLLVRHGETDLNAHHQFQGQMDMPLNDHGRMQAQALHPLLVAEPIAAVYVSDLQRAEETRALVLAGRDIATITDQRLRELNFGAWEGLTYDDIQAQDAAALAAWEADMLNHAPPRGETLAQFAARVQAVVADIRAQYADGETVLVVAHGGVLQLILCAALNLPPTAYWQFQVKPASLAEVVFYDAGAILNRLNVR